MSVKKILITMIIFSMFNDNCYPMNIKAVKERPGTMSTLFEELGARLSVPVFKDFLEAIEFGKKNFQDPLMIAYMENEVLLLTIEIKSAWRRGRIDEMIPPAKQRRFLTVAILEAKGRPDHNPGARLAKTQLKVMDLGTGTGDFQPKIKTWLESRGYTDVWIVGMDNGDWMIDRDLPKPDEDMKKEIVQVSDAVLQNKNGNGYRIFYGDAFKHFPKEMIHEFDIVFLNAVPMNMTTSFVQRALRLTKENGMIVLRYEKDSRNFMHVAVLQDFCYEHDLSVNIVNAVDMPEGSTPLYKTAYLIQNGKFAWHQNPLNASEFIEKQFKGARLSEVSA